MHNVMDASWVLAQLSTNNSALNQTGTQMKEQYWVSLLDCSQRSNKEISRV